VTHNHHTIPKEIQDKLPADIQAQPDIRGRAGLPNRRPVDSEWEPSTTTIGDFSWDGPFGYMFIVREDIVDFFHANKIECEFRSVEYAMPRKKRRTVPFPYSGPTLYWAECNTWLSLDMQASEVMCTSSCGKCGEVAYTFRNSGIVIARKNFHGEKMFRITTNGRSAATFVTEEGRRLIVEAGFSNVAFSEAGEIPGA
jgi:hypothetical protein